jgi:hypothetical protein
LILRQVGWTENDTARNTIEFYQANGREKLFARRDHHRTTPQGLGIRAKHGGERELFKGDTHAPAVKFARDGRTGARDGIPQ